MPTLDCDTDRRGGLTLVECTVHNDTPTRRRVRVENRLDGPVRAPPADPLGPSWTDGTATCTLAPGERVALGYASPAPPRERPVAVDHEVVGRGAADDRSVSGAPTVPAPRTPAEADDDVSGDGGDTDGPLRPDGTGVALPPAVGAWLSALERRVEAVEDGRRRCSPGHATVVVDRETLSALEQRARALEGRLAAAREDASDPGA
jgi:hypothetical protein